MFVFKICHRTDWSEAERAGVYRGSAKDIADGFLHFSLAEQLMGTLAKHYAGASDILLVAVDADALGATLKFEPSRDGALFPHLYAPLPLSAVLWAKPIALLDGRFVLPSEVDSAAR